MPFGWSNKPLAAEQKLANLFYTVDNTLDALGKAYRMDNPLKDSTIDGLEFSPVHGYRAVMRWGSGRVFSPNLEPGYWMVYAERIGSLGDDRHKWPVWDNHMARYEPLPKGLLSRDLPRDYLGETFGDRSGGLRRPVNEDLLIAATIEKNKWRPGPHNTAPDFFFKK